MVRGYWSSQSAKVTQITSSLDYFYWYLSVPVFGPVQFHIMYGQCCWISLSTVSRIMHPAQFNWFVHQNRYYHLHSGRCHCHTTHWLSSRGICSERCIGLVFHPVAASCSRNGSHPATLQYIIVRLANLPHCSLKMYLVWYNLCTILWIVWSYGFAHIAKVLHLHTYNLVMYLRINRIGMFVCDWSSFMVIMLSTWWPKSCGFTNFGAPCRKI